MTNSYNFNHNNTIKNRIINNGENDINFEKNIITQSNFGKNAGFSLSHQRSLSGKFENNDINKKRYFDYVNELKKQFDQNKIRKALKKEEQIQKKVRTISENSNNNNQKIMLLNQNLYFNYSDNFNNKNNIDEYPLKSSYNNSNYYNQKRNEIKYMNEKVNNKNNNNNFFSL